MTQLYDNFLAMLEERYPQKSDLVNALADILPLEKESIYRRLRKNVYFTAAETMRIAGAWNISLDNIACTNSEQIRPFRFNMINFADPEEQDYLLLEQHNRNLELVAGDPNGRMYKVLNSLPRGLYARSEPLTRFFTMKWLYRSAKFGEACSFQNINIPERMRTIDEEYVRRIHAIPEVHCIHDDRWIENPVREIVYFRSIGMVTAAEATLLRDELLALLCYIEEATAYGTFLTTNNKIFFYLSRTWLETEYVLCRSRSFNMCLVKLLERNSLVSMDRMAHEKFTTLIHSMKQSSVLMSESNALQQAEFFKRQREVIMTI